MHQSERGGGDNFFKEIYCTERIYSTYKDNLQNCSLNHFFF